MADSVDPQNYSLTDSVDPQNYSLADSVNFCLFPELFLFPVLPVIPENNMLRPNMGFTAYR